MTAPRYNSPDCREPKSGDWVRFMSGGELLIGQVEYITKDVLGYTELVTTEGRIDIRYVLEVRKP